jgi:hypothetical protein
MNTKTPRRVKWWDEEKDVTEDATWSLIDDISGEPEDHDAIADGDNDSDSWIMISSPVSSDKGNAKFAAFNNSASFTFEEWCGRHFSCLDGDKYGQLWDMYLEDLSNYLCWPKEAGG